MCKGETTIGGLEGAGQQVWLHVYDLGPVSKWVLNSWAATGNLGAFHCGIEVLNREWCFQAAYGCGKEDMRTGVTAHKAREHPRHVYRESVLLGTARMSVREVRKVLNDLEGAWPASSYHFIRRNCVDFAMALHGRLGLSTPFPDWPKGCSKGFLMNTALADLDMNSSMPLLGFCSSSEGADTKSGVPGTLAFCGSISHGKGDDVINASADQICARTI
jgi:hypothetical protein